MTLNPSAQVFVPSSQTLRLLKGNSSQAVNPQKDKTQYEYSPPQLESLYIDSSAYRDDEDILSSQTLSLGKALDYTNFDLPFFFHDMMSADSEDFSNYLSDRAEYLLGYAGTSQTHALEIVDTILETVFSLLKKNGKEYRRPLKLAAEMCDMDQTFLQMMLQQMLRLLDYLHHPLSRDLAYSVLLGLMLSELHVGTCIAPPETRLGFSKEICDLFQKLLSERGALSATLFALEQCEVQLKAMFNKHQVDTICSSLQKVSARFASNEVHKKCAELVNKLRQPMANRCLKTHAMPVAQLNDEEAQDFEMFLRESRRNFSQCRS